LDRRRVSQHDGRAPPHRALIERPGDAIYTVCD